MAHHARLLMATTARLTRLHARPLTIRTLTSSPIHRSNESHERPSDIEPTAKRGDSAKGPTQDGHLLDKKHRLDVHSDAAASARAERGQSHGAPDAVKASTEKSNGEHFTQQREEAIGETSKRVLGWQPGQGGEQVAGHGKSEGSSVGGQKSAMDESLVGKAKKVLGIGERPHRSFSTSAASSVVKKPAAPPSQTPKQGGYSGTEHTVSQSVSPDESKLHDSTDRPRASYTHVKGQPEPDSFREDYVATDDQSASGRVPRSSTSGDAFNVHTTQDHPHYPEGTGRSHSIDTLAEAVEALEEGKGKAKGGEHAKGGIAYEHPEGSQDLQYEKQIPPEFNEKRAHYRPPLDKKAPKRG